MRSAAEMSSGAEISSGYVAYDPIEKLIQSETEQDYYDRKSAEIGEMQAKYKRDQEARWLAEMALGITGGSYFFSDLCGDKGYFDDTITEDAPMIDSQELTNDYGKVTEYQSDDQDGDSTYSNVA